MTFIKHTVTEMDESLIQNCVICGKEISNYQNAMYLTGSPAPKGFPSGSVYVMEGNPTIYQTEEPKEGYESCKY